MSIFVVITVPADVLAPLGARPSAGTVMTTFRSCISYMHIHEGLAAWTPLNISNIHQQYTEHKYSLLMHCIKIKSPANFLLNEQYVFVGGNIYFLCVLSCSSEEA